MTICITADLQLCDNPRDAYRFAFLDKLPKIIEQHRVDTLLVLGDLTEEKDRHSAWLTNTIVDKFNKIGSFTSIIFLQGNHDAAERENPFFRFFSHMPRISWISKPTMLDLPDAGGKCYFLPHTDDPQRDWQFNFDNVKFVFCHQTFNGASIGFGRKITGIIADDYFPAGVQIVAGDIHKPQRMANVHYVGAPYTVDFGDDYEGRILLLRKGKLTEAFVDLPDKRVIDITWPKLKAPQGAQRGDIVRVRVTLPPGDYARWHDIREKVREWCVRLEFVPHQILPVVEHVARQRATTARSYAPKSDDVILREYAQSVGIDKSTLNAGLKLIREV